VLGACMGIAAGFTKDISSNLKLIWYKSPALMRISCIARPCQCGSLP